MIYTTGTIAISGNTLTGTGTNFTAAGSLIRNGCTVIALTSPVQVFQITAIGSATSLTVTPAANPAIPAGTKYAILLSDSLSVDGLAQDIAETFTMYQRYMSGFADVMNGTTDVTITINGVAVTVPGQKSLAKKGANSDITSLSGLTTALSIEQGGTGSTTAAGARTNLGLGDSATKNVGTAAGTVAAGDDLRFGTVNGKTGGTISSGVTINGKLVTNGGTLGTFETALASPGYKQPPVNDSSATSAVFGNSFEYNNGVGFALTTAFGAVGNGTSAWPSTVLMQAANNGAYGARIWTFSMSTGDLVCNGSGNQGGSYSFTKSAISDRELKDDIQYNDGLQSYENVKKILPCTFVYKDDTEGRTRRGVIAQDIREIDEEYVKEIPNYFDDTSTLALDTNVLLLDTMLALKYTIKQLEETQKELAELKNIFAGS